jgi:hypothetical protein
LTVDVTHDEVTYTLRNGEEGLTLRHDGRDLQLDSASPTVVKVRPRVPLLSTPVQPPGRAPAPHRG